jgi:hypothetical protein
MKPLFSIAGNIYVRARNHLDLFARRIRVRKHMHVFIVPSHKWWAIVCLLLMSCVLPVFGTSGVVIVTRDSVIIAADSAVKHTNPKGETTHFTQECKILKEGNIFYFSAGEYGYRTLGFDLFSIEKNAIIKAGNIKNIYQTVEAPILAHLPAIVQRNKTTSPDVYAKWLRGVPIISIVFASFEENVPVAALVEFRIDANERVAPPSERTMISVPGQLQMVLIVSDEVNAATSSDSWNRRFLSDPVNSSQEVIQLEIDASIREKRFDVGPPISILLISRDSSGMVPGHEGKCQTNR